MLFAAAINVQQINEIFPSLFERAKVRRQFARAGDPDSVHLALFPEGARLDENAPSAKAHASGSSVPRTRGR